MTIFAKKLVAAGLILTKNPHSRDSSATAPPRVRDIGASWESTAKQISAGINHSMAGIPYWTFDIGAFS